MNEPIHKAATGLRYALYRLLFRASAYYLKLVYGTNVEMAKRQIRARRRAMACEKPELWNGYPWFGL